MYSPLRVLSFASAPNGFLAVTLILLSNHSGAATINRQKPNRAPARVLDVPFSLKQWQTGKRTKRDVKSELRIKDKLMFNALATLLIVTRAGLFAGSRLSQAAGDHDDERARCASRNRRSAATISKHACRRISGLVARRKRTSDLDSIWQHGPIAPRLQARRAAGADYVF